jgi:hypothetical protein
MTNRSYGARRPAGEMKWPGKMEDTLSLSSNVQVEETHSHFDRNRKPIT